VQSPELIVCCVRREQATDQLKATKAGPEQTRQMMEVLQRLHEQEQTAGHRCDGSSSDGSSDGSSSDTDSDADLDPAKAAAPGHPRRIIPALKQLLKRVSVVYVPGQHTLKRLEDTKPGRAACALSSTCLWQASQLAPQRVLMYVPLYRACCATGSMILWQAPLL
jgi:hypothetical protein